MPENLELEKQLKLAKRTGSYLVGRREVVRGLKGSKLLVWSASANVQQSILDQSRDFSVPAIKFGGNPVELGRACGIPFRVSVIAVKSPGDADLSGFVKSADYEAVFSGARSLVVEPKAKERPVDAGKVPKETKPKKLPKEKSEEDVKAPSSKKSRSEEKTEEKDADKPKEKKTKAAKKISGPSKKSTKKKKSDDEEE